MTRARDPSTGRYISVEREARREAARGRARDQFRMNGKFATRSIKVEYDWRDKTRDAKLKDRTERSEGIHYRASVERTIRSAFSDPERIRQQLDRRHPNQAHFRVMIGGEE